MIDNRFYQLISHLWRGGKWRLTRHSRTSQAVSDQRSEVIGGLGFDSLLVSP